MRALESCLSPVDESTLEEMLAKEKQDDRNARKAGESKTRAKKPAYRMIGPKMNIIKEHKCKVVPPKIFVEDEELKSEPWRARTVDRPLDLRVRYCLHLFSGQRRSGDVQQG